MEKCNKYAVLDSEDVYLSSKVVSFLKTKCMCYDKMV